jgi:hypothetical protein
MDGPELVAIVDEYVASSLPPSDALVWKIPSVIVHADVALLHVSVPALTSLYTAQRNETVAVLGCVGGPRE